MDSFWTAVVYLWLAATGALVAFVIFSWFARGGARRKRIHEHRRPEPPRPSGCTTIDV